MSSKRSEFISGMKATIPLIVGAIPFGILFGTLAPNSGLSIPATLAMSLFVFAGSAQFIVLALIASGVGLSVIILTTLVVNLRHLLYATALVDKVKHLPLSLRALMAFGLTDETFAAVSLRYQSSDNKLAHWYYLGSMIAMYSNWFLCTVLGVILGESFPDMSQWGLEFAMAVTFIGMVVPYLNTAAMWSAVIVAASCSIVFANLPHKLGLIVSALSGIAVGMLIIRIQKAKRQSTESPNDNRIQGER